MTGQLKAVERQISDLSGDFRTLTLEDGQKKQADTIVMLGFIESVKHRTVTIRVINTDAARSDTDWETVKNNLVVVGISKLGIQITSRRFGKKNNNLKALTKKLVDDGLIVVISNGTDERYQDHYTVRKIKKAISFKQYQDCIDAFKAHCSGTRA